MFSLNVSRTFKISDYAASTSHTKQISSLKHLPLFSKVMGLSS